MGYICYRNKRTLLKMNNLNPQVININSIAIAKQWTAEHHFGNRIHILLSVWKRNRNSKSRKRPCNSNWWMNKWCSIHLQLITTCDKWIEITFQWTREIPKWIRKFDFHFIIENKGIFDRINLILKKPQDICIKLVWNKWIFC